MKKCGKKFGLNEDASALIGKKIQCRHCFHSWNYIPVLSDLSSKLKLIDAQLSKANIKIKEEQISNQNKISKLVNEIDIKKNEIHKQDKAIETIKDLQDRLLVTDQINSKNEKLNNQISNLQLEIKDLDRKIQKRNQDIQIETNLIEAKIVNYSSKKADDNENNFSKVQNYVMEDKNIGTGYPVKEYFNKKKEKLINKKSKLSFWPDIGIKEEKK